MIKRLIQSGIGVVGKHLINLADIPTGGLTSKLLNKTADYAKDNAGLIGNTIGRMGRSVLHQSIRDKLSDAATNAIKLLPTGKVKDTLKSINESAQDRYQDDNPRSPIYNTYQTRQIHSDTGAKTAERRRRRAQLRTV